MNADEKDTGFVAACGLYCGNCPSVAKGKCPGCRKNEKATWCAVRTCCHERNIASCAECTVIPHVHCKKFNAFIARVFGFIFNSDRNACIGYIKQHGYETFVAKMKETGRLSFKRR